MSRRRPKPLAIRQRQDAPKRPLPDEPTVLKRRPDAAPDRRERRRRRPQWPVWAAVVLGIGSAWGVVPVVSEAMGRTSPAAWFAAPWFSASAAQAQTTDPAYSRLPAGRAPDVEARARATVVVTQLLEVVKVQGGKVVRVSVDNPAVTREQIAVPVQMVWEGDYEGVQRIVKTAQKVYPHLAWASCKLTQLPLLDEPDPAVPRNPLRVEVGFATLFTPHND